MFAAASKTASSSAATYIEDVFSTWLYTGNSSTQTITNGIDLAGKGGLVWFKRRNGAGEHSLFDTARGATKYLQSQATTAQTTNSTSLTSFNADGFSLGNNGLNNFNGETFATWTFREQPKFFDVVTYNNGDGVNPLTVPHNLGSVPGTILIKRYDGGTTNWIVYHRALGATQYMVLNSTAAAVTSSSMFNNTEPTATDFTVGTSSAVNGSGFSYVAYLFAHNAGGFGLTGTDNVISCGSFTGGNAVNLGYEPQWLLIKGNTSGSNWVLVDAMRGMSYGVNGDAYLYANTTAAEAVTDLLDPTPTGFTNSFNSAYTYIYIAIRRGPMKPPTSGTSVFAPVAYTGDGSYPRTLGSLSASDLGIVTGRGGDNRIVADRLRGGENQLFTNLTNSESTGNSLSFTASQRGMVTTGQVNGSSVQYILWLMRRAPSFFDEVCYTGTGVDNAPLANNLNALPELVLIKQRSTTGNWVAQFNFSGVNYSSMQLNTTNAAGNFSKGSANSINSFVLNIGANSSGITYVAYLFASCPGVSKVGSYTGNDTSQNIDCGFAAGARFVLIKRTSSASSWYVFDTARGFASEGFITWNNTNAEGFSPVISALASGFTVSQTGEGLNAAGQTYIFLAIA